MKLKEIFTIFMDYSGKGIYPFLFLVALTYLLATEKDSKIRRVLLESSLVITVLFLSLIHIYICQTDSCSSDIVNGGAA